MSNEKTTRRKTPAAPARRARPTPAPVQAAAPAMKKAEKPARAARRSSKPTWWTDAIQTAWDSAKAEATASFGAAQAAPEPAAAGVPAASGEPVVSTPAIAFGYGARHAYMKLNVWGVDLEARLQTDWKDFGLEAVSTWANVRARVQHGWERARDAVQAPPTK